MDNRLDGKGKEAWSLIFCLCENKSGKFGGSAPKTPEVPVITNDVASAINLETI